MLTIRRRFIVTPFDTGILKNKTKSLDSKIPRYGQKNVLIVRLYSVNCYFDINDNTSIGIGFPET